jgi:hypothetical protein
MVAPEMSGIGDRDSRRARRWRLPALIVAVVLLFCAFMTATAGTAIIPSIQKWAAPILCQQPYGKMVIQSESGSYMPGESYTSYTEACADSHGRLKPVSGLADRAVVMAETFLGLGALAVLLTMSVLLLSGEDRRRRRG